MLDTICSMRSGAMINNEDIRTCDTCGEQTDINVCWTDRGDYWCSDECVPKRKWVQMFGEHIK